MVQKNNDYDAIAEHLDNTLDKIRSVFGICHHKYEHIKTIKIDQLKLKSDSNVEDLKIYLENPALIIIHKCKLCNKIKENHYIEVEKH